MSWSATYPEYRDTMLNSRVKWKFQELSDSAYLGFATTRGALRFLTDVQNYLWSVCENGGSPLVWDKIVRRARRHGLEGKVRALRATFIHEKNLHARYANEGIDEFEANQRRVF